MRFSERTNWNTEESELALAHRLRREAGLPIADLTASNPTHCGFTYPPDLLQALADPQALDYEPQPRGNLDARQAVCAYYASHDVRLDPGQIILTTSTSEAYSFLFRLLCDPGSEVLIPQPGYPLFDFLARLDDVRLKAAPLIYHEGWQIDIEGLRRALTTETRAIVVVHPNNPTGHYTKPWETEELARICRAFDLSLIVDEVFLDYTMTGNEGGREQGNQKNTGNEGTREQGNQKDTGNEGTREQGNQKDTGNEGAREQGSQKDTGNEGTREQGNQKDTGNEGAREQGNQKDTGNEGTREQGNQKDTGNKGTREQGNQKDTGNDGGREQGNQKNTGNEEIRRGGEQGDKKSGGVEPGSFAAGLEGVPVFVVSGLSKIAGLPQMKAAWIVVTGPEQAQCLDRLEVIADTFLSMNAPIQCALPAWLDGRAAIQDQIRQRVAGNLAELDRRLTQLPIVRRLTAEAGWYAVLRIPALAPDEQTVLALLERGVWVHPGYFFGMPDSGWLVLSLLTDPAEFSTGVALLVDYFETNQGSNITGAAI